MPQAFPTISYTTQPYPAINYVPQPETGGCNSPYPAETAMNRLKQPSSGWKTPGWFAVAAD